MSFLSIVETPSGGSYTAGQTGQNHYIDIASDRDIICANGQDCFGTRVERNQLITINISPGLDPSKEVHLLFYPDNGKGKAKLVNANGEFTDTVPAADQRFAECDHVLFILTPGLNMFQCSGSEFQLNEEPFPAI